MASYAELLNVVSRYEATFRRDDVPPLETAPLYDLFPDSPSILGWPQRWPNADNAGIYAILDANLRLLYVGKSSMNSGIGARLSAYFAYDDRRRCKVKDSSWTAPPRYVVTIGVPKSMKFEAPALEEFVISELNPPDNVAGRTIS